MTPGKGPSEESHISWVWSYSSGKLCPACTRHLVNLCCTVPAHWLREDDFQRQAAADAGQALGCSTHSSTNERCQVRIKVQYLFYAEHFWHAEPFIMVIYYSQSLKGRNPGTTAPYVHGFQTFMHIPTIRESTRGLKFSIWTLRNRRIILPGDWCQNG